MRFLQRQSYPLVFAAVLVFCSVMVIRQVLLNQTEHVDTREDFILLCNEGQTQAAQRLYQVLIQQLPHLPDRTLIADQQRLALLMQKDPPPPALVWKYDVSLRNELQSRAGHRLTRALQRAQLQ